MRRAALLLALTGLPAALPAQQQPGGNFDLVGPSLRGTVTRGQETLPLAEVPNLLPGDRVRVGAELPSDQSARYVLVVAFLRGATNPPPREWILSAETWARKGRTIDAPVPEGAEQVLAFLVPETGGAVKAVQAAVRDRPGAFVRAAQALNQARLDRARLDAFLAGVRPKGPAGDPADRERAVRAAPAVAKSLGVRFDASCLSRAPELQAACLSQDSGQLVLPDAHSSSVAETLAGTPVNLAYTISATPEGGFGYYSAYIGVVRDLARLLGAFQSARLQFIPALSVERGDRTELLLNAVPSFRKPQSVLVAAMPPVAPAQLPPLTAGGAPGAAALCAARPGLVLPVEGAPLVFGTRYARRMTLRVEPPGAPPLELAVAPDAEKGGYVLSDPERAGPALAAAAGKGPADARLKGYWGFQPFEGPRYRLMWPAARGGWSVADGASLVVGRDTPLELRGGAAPCVSAVAVERATGAVPVAFEVRGGDALMLKVPLADAEPGPVTLSVQSFGAGEPQLLNVQSYTEVSRVTRLTLHAGEREAVLTGTRLDQLASMDVGGVAFRPAGLERSRAGDRLTLSADSAGVGEFRAGQVRPGRALLADGRSLPLRVTVQPPRPAFRLGERTVAAAGALRSPDAALVPADARLTVQLLADGQTRFDGRTRVEVAVEEPAGSVVLVPRVADPSSATLTLEPRALGPDARGALRLRVVEDGVAGAWASLGTLVRVPAVAAACAGARCRLTGTGLGLIRTVVAGAERVAVPETAVDLLEVPRPPAGRPLLLHLRDAPDAAFALAPAG